MKALVIIVVVAAPGCATESDPPSCIDVGCVEQPSGTSDIWSPCAGSSCFCQTGSEPVECMQDVPACPVLGCTVPTCNDVGCFCNGMACVPTGIPVPTEVRQ